MKVNDEKYLIQSACYGYIVGVARSLVSGANPNVADNDGLSALHYVVANDDPVCVALLLLAGADPRQRTTPDGPTLLEIAIGSGNAAAADMLVLGGAD